MSELANQISQLKNASESKDKLGSIAELLERNNISLEDIGRISKVSLYQQAAKDADGEFMTTDLVAVQLSPKWETGPEWPVIQQAEPTVIKPAKTNPKPKKTTDLKCAVILPDPQIGYRRYEDGSLDPFHDEAAINVAMQVTAHLQKTEGVDLIVNLGDFIDLPEHSKYVQEAAFAQTTHIAINRGHKFLAEQRATCPDAKIILLEGNHDNRMNLYATNNAKASYGLRKANTPDSWPVLSVPYLLRLEELDVEFRDKYPANEFWINKNLRAVHGDKVRSNGSTASAYANALPHISTIFGHIHRLEVQYKTVHDHAGPIRSANVSPGCLCRVDGAVPSTHSGVGSDGRPATRWENWQQGMAIVWYSDEGRFHIETLHILDGWTIYKGQEFRADI